MLKVEGVKYPLVFEGGMSMAETETAAPVVKPKPDKPKRRWRGGRNLRPSEIAATEGVKVEKVLSWIRSGQLLATNMATNLGGRPQWRIDPADLAAFKAARASKNMVPAAVQRRPRTTPGVRQYV